MISCGEAEEFTPYGRDYMVHHPGVVGLAPINSSTPELDHIEILRELDTVSLNSSKDWWTIRKSKDGLTEEELYFSGRTVVWSRGQMGLEGSKDIIKSITCDSQVLQAFFATFYTYPDLPVLIGDDLPDKPTGKHIPSICILEKDYLTICTEDGEDFSIAPPFIVRKVWPMKFGILLERQVTATEVALPSDSGKNLPILYSLLHPLDEINPVLLIKDKNGCSDKQMYMKDHQQQIVSIHNNPSICILHTRFSSTLKICSVRRSQPEENMTLLQSSILGAGMSAIGTPLTSVPLSVSQGRSHSHPSSPSGSTVPVHSIPAHSPTPTPTSSSRQRPTTTSVHQHTPRRLHTPHTHLATISRNFSPSLANCQQMRLGLTPSPVRSLGSALGSKLPKGLHNQSVVLNDTLVEPEPLIPDICLEVMWSGPCSGRPTTSFLSEDTVGQKFLCLLFPQHITLKCYQYELKNDYPHVIIGTETNLMAKDAVPLTGLNMMVVVDPSNSLMLYTGTVQVCRLHLAGLSTLNSTLFKDFSYLNISSKLNSPLSTPLRRSSLLTSSRPSSSLDIKFEAGLSPVLNEKTSPENSFLDDPALPLSSAIVCVKDATDFRLTLEHTSGNLYRVTLPKIWSSVLVEKCLVALKYILPKELGLQLVNKWYTNRNTPGNGDFSPSTEWHLFSKTILSLIGYDVEKLSPSSHLDLSGSTSPLIVSKKFRAAESGSESDWEYLLSSAYHQALGSNWSEVLKLDYLELVTRMKDLNPGTLNTSAPFFQHLVSILFALHLVYEEFKANTLHWDLTSLMIPCLTQLAADLRAPLYLDHYWRDYPNLCSLKGPSTQMSADSFSELYVPDYFTREPPSLYAHLFSIMKNINCSPFPYIPSVSTSTKKLILLYRVAATNASLKDIPIHKFLFEVRPGGERTQEPFSDVFPEMQVPEPELLTINEKIVMLTNQLGLTSSEISVMAPGISLLLMNAQHMCRTYPPQNWPASAYQLIDRPDLVAQKLYTERYKDLQKKSKGSFKKGDRDPYRLNACCSQNKEEMEPNPTSKVNDKPKEEDDGMETLDLAMLALRWPEDQRVSEVRKMVCSSRPVTINITQRPGISDHDFLEEQERQLYALSIRTMALPMGRGMLTLCTHAPIITEALPIPPLNLKGRAPPRGTTIDFPISEVPADMDMWPLFHNGVAAGLKIAPNCSDITSTWIVYNKSKGDASVSLSHAGFLMALGLNGHLRNFATVSLHDYLSQGLELTCVGLLLGISAAMRGTMDMQTTKVLSVHLECMLPPTSTELDVPHNVQVAAVLGVGLVYADTGHRHMAEVLLQEIGRPPGPEMENSTDRESYSLAAGLGLGLVMFGRGAELVHSSDFNLAGQLHHYIEGGHRKPLSGIMREKYKSPSYQIKEGDRVNINVTSPGATLALGMVYFRSDNKAIAEWMAVPNTPYMLDQVRPDFLLLRTIAKGLILWDEVMPTYKWVEGHVPTTILQHVHRSGNQSTPGIDYESIHQAYYNILAGACFVLGLKFAGSANSEAFHVLWKYTRMFTNFTKRSIAELAGKSTIETCLCSVLLSLSMVMAGTGDLEVLRLIRFLRSRVGIAVSTVGYGSHMAIHMALGFLFLGGGRFSLGTSNIALASLIISCFPKFPTHSNDNRYHLQAFRHLYVLASEPRLFLPFDVDSGSLRIAKILLRFADTKSYQDQQYVAKAPHMLPELSKLKEVIVEGDVGNPRFWPVRFSKGTESWHVLKTLLSSGSGIPLKLKEGRFPYGESPVSYDYKSSYLLSQEKSSHWTIKLSVLKEVFGCSSEFIDSLVAKEIDSSAKELFDHQMRDVELSKTLTTIIYDYLSIGKPATITNLVNALQAIRKVYQFNYLSGPLIWQIKLIAACSFFLLNLTTFASNHSPSPDLNSHKPTCDALKMDMDEEVPVVVEPFVHPLVSSERALSLLKRIELLADGWGKETQDELQRYFSGDSSHGFSPKCAFLLLLRDVPCMEKLPSLKGSDHPVTMLQQLQRQKFSKAVKSAADIIFSQSS